MRSGPKGETQLTPTPIARRGLAELPRKNSLNPGAEAKSAGVCTAPVSSTLQSATGLVNETRLLVLVADGEQMYFTSSSDGCLTCQSDPTSTKADGLRPRLLSPELTGNSSSSRPM